MNKFIIFIIPLIIANIIIISDAKKHYQSPDEWEFAGLTGQWGHSDIFNRKSNNKLNYNIFESDDRITNAIKESRDAVEQWRVELGIPGVVAGVSVNGKEVWTEGFGYTNIENGVKANRDSVWRLGSISKSLTSTLVGTLIDEKLIDLDNKISSQLSSDIFTPKVWKGHDYKSEITLKQVMSHTAGLRVTKVFDDWIGQPLFIADNVTHAYKIESQRYKNDPMLFEPGKGFNYSNFGYQTVGAFVEHVLLAKKKITFEHAINEMFKKLGMSSTMAERRGTIVPNRARYYQRNEKEHNLLENVMIVDDIISIIGWWPCGGIISTVPDLLTFGQHIIKSYKGFEGSLLTKETLTKLWTPATMLLTDHPGIYDTRFAMGWIVTNFTEKNTPQFEPLKWSVWHNGGLFGASTHFAIYPEFDIVVAIVANQRILSDINPLSQNIAKYFAGQ